MSRGPAARVVLPTLLAVLLLAKGVWASSWSDELVIELPSENVTSLRVGGATPCCDNCGICVKSTCKCNDVLSTCPTWCSLCLPSILPPFKLVCSDFTSNVCKTKCTAPPPPPSPSPPPPSPPPPSPSPPPPSSPPPPLPSKPCCDKCSTCQGSACKCNDLTTTCPTWCSSCTRAPLPPYNYICNDYVDNICQIKCTAGPPSPSPRPPSPPPPSFSPPPPPRSPSPPPSPPSPPPPLPSLPCCDKCSICKGSKCKCSDGLPSCPKWCKSCTRSLLFPFNYVCNDYVDNICQTRCTVAPPPPPPPPCCDHCGYCDSIVPLVPKKCRCRDMLPSCPLWCSKCTQFAGLYECLDLKLNYCSKTCTPK